MPDRHPPPRFDGPLAARRARALALLGLPPPGPAPDEGLERWAALFEGLPVATVLCDARGGLRKLNLLARQLLGCEQGLGEGTVLEAFVAHPDEQARLRRAFAVALQGGRVELTGLGLSLPRRSLVCRLQMQALPAAPLRDRIAVTLQANAEPGPEARQAAARRPGVPPPPAPESLAALAHLTTHWVLLTDPQHRITWCNDAFCAGTGYTPQEAFGRTPAGLLGGGALDMLRLRQLRDTLLQGEPVRGERLQARTKAGRALALRLDIHPLRREDGAVAQHVSVLADISQQLRDEAALRDSRAELGAVFDAEPDALVLLRRDGSVLRGNAAARQLFGLHAEGPRRLRECIAPADRAAFGRMLRGAVLGRSSNGPLAALAPGPGAGQGAGTGAVEVPLRLHCVPVFGGGEVLRVLVVARDISEELAVQAMRISHGIAQEASRAKTEFIARISHELRTPLNAIMGFAQLLQAEDDTAPVERRRAHLAQVLAAGAHLSALINDLLDLSRIEGRTLEVACVPTGLASVMQRAVALFALPARHQGVHIDFEPPPEALQARVDSTRLTQVLANLLSNGVKYNRQGGWVRLRAGSELQPWVEVADSGPGFTPAQREHLFEPFNRLGAEKGPVEGTGIGLAIAHQLVELMGGRLLLAERPGAGAVFRIELQPAGPAPSEAPAEPPGAGRPAPAPAPVPLPATGPRVLYIEDDEVNTVLIQCLFDSLPGWVLETATTVAQGLQRARALRPDLVLLDLQLPDGTGLDVCAALAQQDETAGIPCILVTADASEETRHNARQAGCIDVQHKPLDLQRLRAAMAGAWVGGRASPR